MKRLTTIAFIMLLSGGVAGIGGLLLVQLPEFTSHSLSAVLLDYEGEVLCTDLTADEKWRLPLNLSKVPPLFVKMLVACEDKRFYNHYGVDPAALVRAAWQWIKNRRIISGGSTLTMQTVRLLQPRPRTLIYKIREIFLALGLELFYAKDEILTIYLTLAPYGGNIEGLRAASFAYFNVDYPQLNPSQMALLVAIPQSPTALHPHVYPARAKKNRDRIIQRLATGGILTLQQAQELSADPIPVSRFCFPAHASHVMRLLRFRDSKPALNNKLASNIYQTTLHKKKQIVLEEMLRNEIAFFDAHQTAAAMVVENSTRNIVAYGGSADPHSEARNGFVDMIQAIRSPGSTLKPFIYALGFEDNIIHPETLIDDTLTNFNGYMPTNFRDAFHGRITIREALQQSLNIPVVCLLERLGAGRFVDWLGTCQVTLFFPDAHQMPGLPIALGGVGIRFWDLVSLYCALANAGKYRPLTLTPRALQEEDITFVSPLASWYVTKILEEAPAPSGFVDRFTTQKNLIAFKTGTSYGARDALCLGYTSGDKGYTVGVWTGRPDGSPAPNQLGRKTAAPLLFKIFYSIAASQDCSQETPFATLPVNALNIPNYLLPEALRWFSSASMLAPLSAPLSKSMATSLENSLPVKHRSFYKTRFISPQNETTYMVQKGKNGQLMPIHFVLQGRGDSFLFLVNGKPAILTVSSKNNRTISASWIPSGTGFYNLTYIDSEGYSDTITLRLVS